MGNKLPVGGDCSATASIILFSDCYCMPPTVPGAPAAPRGPATSALGLGALECS